MSWSRWIGKRRERRGLEERRATAGDKREHESGRETVDQRYPEKRGRAHRVRNHHAQPARPVISRSPEQWPQEHRRQKVGEEDQADRPTGREAIVGDDEESDIARASTQRGLRQHRKIQAGHALVP